MDASEHILDVLDKQVAVNAAVSAALAAMSQVLDSLDRRLKDLEARVA